MTDSQGAVILGSDCIKMAPLYSAIFTEFIQSHHQILKLRVSFLDQQFGGRWQGAQGYIFSRELGHFSEQNWDMILCCPVLK